MEKCLIVAIADNGAIGKNNELLWHISEDLKFFRRTTLGCPVIMGRKTFESLPKGALPNRRNIVLSRQEGLHYENAECYRSLEEALMQCDYTEDVFIIGGGELYKQTLGLAKRLYLTLVDDVPAEADAFFPEIDPAMWEVASSEAHATDEKHLFPYRFVDYCRTR